MTDLNTKFYAVTDQAYDALHHAKFDSDLARKMTLPRVAAYTRAWINRVRAEATETRNSDALPRETQVWHASPALAVLSVYSLNYHILTVRIYSDRVRVRCEDIDIARGEYEYMYAALTDLNSPTPADADDDTNAA